MTVGILTNTYSPDLNGVSIAVKNLKENLEIRGVKVVVATPKIEGRKYPEDIFAIRAIPTDDIVSPDLAIPYLYINQVAKFFESQGVDVVHTHDTMIGGAEGIAIAAKLNIPCVHTFHTFIEQYPYLNLPLRNKAIRKMILIFLNNYNHITAPSVKVYKYLSGLGIRTPMTHLVNVTGCNDLRRLPFDKDLGAILGILPTDFVFLTFCRVAKEKNVEIGIITMLPLMRKYPNIKYIIAGQGPEVENLQKLVNYLNISEQVIFVGRYQLEDLNLIGCLAKVFLFTSHTENLPTNLLEAMSLALPVVSVDDEAVKYLLKHGENGYMGSVDEMTDYCEKLYLDRELTERFAENSLVTALEFQNQDTTQKYIDLYEKVIRQYTKSIENPEKKVNAFLRYLKKNKVGIDRY
jgi:1,2-diacylglycerol 3-alpha-glucosyltransferase